MFFVFHFSLCLHSTASFPQTGPEEKSALFVMTAVNQVKLLLFRHVDLCGQQHHKASPMQAVYLSCCATLNPMTPERIQPVSGLKRVKMQMKYYHELVFEE